MSVLQIVIVLIRGIVADRSELAAENLALRQQLAVLEQCSKRPRLRKRDRIFWVWLSRFWSNWRSVIVQPETAVRWHQQGFRMCWRWKSRTGKVGRPRLKYAQPSSHGRLSRQEAFVPQTFAAAGGACVRQSSSRLAHFHADGVFRNDTA